jgi:lipopolysaccharide transport system permease protein
MDTSIEQGNEHWTEIIKPQSTLFNFQLKEVWHYRDLLILLVRRDFVATYKQTVLGPIWFFLQPILVAITFSIIFKGIAGISTDGLPSLLFYISGLTFWNYFAECLNKTSTVFRDNAAIFGKVYFPRLVMPFSIVVSNLIKLGIQLILFVALWLYYLCFTDTSVEPNLAILLLPILVLIMGCLGLGAGMIISAMTTKYRDLIFLLAFGVQLLMYTTTVIYPLSTIAGTKRILILANPMTSVIEAFRFAFTGYGVLSWKGLLYSFVFSGILMVVGILTFNKVEKNFMDTV